MFKRGLMTMVAAATLSIAGAYTSGAAVHAAGCPSGSVCVYDRAGRLVYQNPGNASRLNLWVEGGYVWNNGRRDPGQDHITLRTTWSGMPSTICLHYGVTKFTVPGNTAAGIGANTVINGWTWRGECASGEDAYWRPA